MRQDNSSSHQNGEQQQQQIHHQFQQQDQDLLSIYFDTSFLPESPPANNNAFQSSTSLNSNFLVPPSQQGQRYRSNSIYSDTSTSSALASPIMQYSPSSPFMDHPSDFSLTLPSSSFQDAASLMSLDKPMITPATMAPTAIDSNNINNHHNTVSLIPSISPIAPEITLDPVDSPSFSATFCHGPHSPVTLSDTESHHHLHLSGHNGNDNSGSMKLFPPKPHSVSESLYSFDDNTSTLSISSTSPSVSSDFLLSPNGYSPNLRARSSSASRMPINDHITPSSPEPPRPRASSTTSIPQLSVSSPSPGPQRVPSPILISQPQTTQQQQQQQQHKNQLLELQEQQQLQPVSVPLASNSKKPSREYILELAAPTPGPRKKAQRHPSAFACDLCDKRFTRAYNLRSHKRTHTNERPFVCSFCSKAFARQHDRKRHESLHSGEKKYECKGVLRDGVTAWGCGHKFARPDALGRHFKTEAGKECIRRLVAEAEEERREKRIEGMIEKQNQHQQHQQQFPAALLEQFPMLSNEHFE